MRADHFRAVDAEILEQHRAMRARLRGLRAHAERASLPWSTRGLRAALLRFAARFDEHLAYEERELAPRQREEERLLDLGRREELGTQMAG